MELESSGKTTGCFDNAVSPVVSRQLFKVASTKDLFLTLSRH
jgi:hypothetical protein